MNVTLIKRQCTILLLAVATVCQTASIANSQEYLSGGDIALISAGAVGISALGVMVKNKANGEKSLIHGPILFDAALQKFLGGDCRANKTNFLDNTVGSAATPVVTGLMLFTADMNWPETEDKGKFVAQDMFLFSSGILATKGVTSLAKGIVSRERPLPCLDPGEAELRNDINFEYDHNSFFSGHASSAFFSAVYLNKRLRSIMRHELTPDEYNGWSWAPPAVLFSWASFVGWSRIQAYKHFFTDVIAGAVAGYLMAELFYSFNDFNEIASSSSQTSGTRQIFSIRLKF